MNYGSSSDQKLQYFAVPRRYRSELVGSKWFRPVPTRFQLITSGSGWNPTGSSWNPVRTAWNRVGTAWNQPVLIGTYGAQQSTENKKESIIQEGFSPGQEGCEVFCSTHLENG